jgi:hypothetical protein
MTRCNESLLLKLSRDAITAHARGDRLSHPVSWTNWETLLAGCGVEEAMTVSSDNRDGAG